jgi:predicted transcriptional regulator
MTGQPDAWWLERNRKPTLINEVQDHVGLRLIQPPNLVIVSAATRKSVQPDYILTLESVRVLASLKFASHAP